jgi:hypothetical protein
MFYSGTYYPRTASARVSLVSHSRILHWRTPPNNSKFVTSSATLASQLCTRTALIPPPITKGTTLKIPNNSCNFVDSTRVGQQFTLPFKNTSAFPSPKGAKDNQTFRLGNVTASPCRLQLACASGFENYSYFTNLKARRIKSWQ